MNDSVYDEIVELCKEGDNLADRGRYEEAIKRYKSALSLIPEPKYDWEASTWVYCALGDVCYLNAQYKLGLNYLFECLKCPDGTANPFILLRQGQCLYEMNKEKMAREYLLQAYMLDGRGIFENEPEKYFEAIKDLVL